MSKKYGFTGKEKTVLGVTLKQIVCLTAFASVLVGDIGGWIESEKNLSQEGDAWVYGDAMVYGNAEVYGDARVYGNARVYGDAEVYGNACVYGDAEVCTKKAITISSQHYHVTITDTHITIGCQNHKKEFWESAGYDDIEKIDGKESAKLWMEMKPFIMMLAKR